MCENRVALSHNKIGDYLCVSAVLMWSCHLCFFSGFVIADFSCTCGAIGALPRTPQRGSSAPGTNEVRATLGSARRRCTRLYAHTLLLNTAQPQLRRLLLSSEKNIPLHTLSEYLRYIFHRTDTLLLVSAVGHDYHKVVLGGTVDEGLPALFVKAR